MVTQHLERKLDYFRKEWTGCPKVISNTEENVRILWELNYKKATSLQSSDNHSIQVLTDSSTFDIGLTAWQQKR